MANITNNPNFIKYVLYIFNFFFAVTGIIILSIGVAVQGAFIGYETFLSGQFFSVPALLIAIGILIFFIAILGCIGAVKENYWITIVFSGFLIIIFILELAAGISGYVLRNDTKNLITTTLQDNIQAYANNTYVQSLYDEIQIDFDCCGAVGWQDWQNKFEKLPLSCCHIRTGIFHNFTCDSTTETLRKNGCVDAFGAFLKSHAVSLGAVGIAMAILQLIGIVLVCCMAKQIKIKNAGLSGLN